MPVETAAACHPVSHAVQAFAQTFRRLAVFGLLLAMAGSLGAPDAAAAKKSKLTCSFIQKQCVKECAKQVNVDFCSVYCADKQAICMQTGRWDGIQRQFDNVRRR